MGLNCCSFNKVPCDSSGLPASICSFEHQVALYLGMKTRTRGDRNLTVAMAQVHKSTHQHFNVSFIAVFFLTIFLFFNIKLEKNPHPISLKFNLMLERNS